MCRIEPYAPQYKDGVIAVVRAVYDEYGFTWEADGYHRDLYEIETSYLQRGGMFWVLLAGNKVPLGCRWGATGGLSASVHSAGKVIGCAGILLDGTECELHRMYLLPEYRGRGLGRRLLDTTIEYGRSQGCRRMRAWSDVLLTHAHTLYLKCGFVQEGERICDDPDQAREHGFWKEPL
jgi:putative acetyltransferase